MKIALLGNIALDITVYNGVESSAFISQKEYAFADKITTCVGGCSVNLSKAILSNGVQPILNSLVAGDETGTMLLKQLKNQKMTTEFIYPLLGENNKTVLYVLKDGNKTMFLHSASIPPMEELEVLFLDRLAGYDYLHIALNKWNRSLIKKIKLKNPNSSLSTDLHLDVETINADVIPYMSVVFFSGVGNDNPEANMKRFMTSGPDLVICTLGEDGCLIGESERNSIRQFPAVKQDKAIIDTIGAGDVFAATFLSEFYQHKNIDKAAIKATIQAGNSCTYAGLDNLYTHEELNNKYEEMRKQNQ